MQAHPILFIISYTDTCYSWLQHFLTPTTTQNTYFFLHLQRNNGQPELAIKARFITVRRPTLWLIRAGRYYELRSKLSKIGFERCQPELAIALLSVQQIKLTWIGIKSAVDSHPD